MPTIRGQRGRYTLDPASRRSGGQAEVFCATNRVGETVAVKIAHGAGQKSVWLKKERAALERLQRSPKDGAPWIVEILDHGETDDGRSFLVLPWYDTDLEEWVMNQAPALERRFFAVEQAALAVLKLHQSPDDPVEVVLHRDLKPGNLLVREEGEALVVVLADLGGVKEGRLLSEAWNTTLHTRDFAPPEQGLPLEVSPDTSLDVHALAVTLYWCLTDYMPDAVTRRSVLYTESAQALMQLFFRAGRRSPEEEERFQTLRQEPLEVLFDLERARALYDEDVLRLRRALHDALLERVEDPAALAEEMERVLVPVLTRALQPNPERREGSPRRLIAACRRCRELLDAAQGGAGVSGATWVPEEGDDAALGVEDTDAPPPAPRQRLPWRGLVLLLGVGGVLLVVGREFRDRGAGAAPTIAAPTPTPPTETTVVAALDTPSEAPLSDKAPPSEASLTTTETSAVSSQQPDPTLGPAGGQDIPQTTPSPSDRAASVDQAVSDAKPAGPPTTGPDPEPPAAPVFRFEVWPDETPFKVFAGGRERAASFSLGEGTHEIRIEPADYPPCLWTVDIPAPLDGAWSVEVKARRPRMTRTLSRGPGETVAAECSNGELRPPSE